MRREACCTFQQKDWKENIAELFEWVGMACLGSERYAYVCKKSSGRSDTRRRLQANDRTDPYVALYDIPEPRSVGIVTHVRWRGDALPIPLVENIVESAYVRILFHFKLDA